ncbi:hypothetical protein QN386_17450 [Pseudomonas sp. CCI3.2]|uniref:hypothetical protein n=1 Tax=unclassified Pseudomonas TaxID=196821 RepID=UPI002AC95232|nr:MULTISPECIES: hypothetical protein [unclassified Pseudomonas]MEB0077776.1 hypothetical protein [Pseudomonas sp. MH10out]MEB0092465.1 hypothetical protein [Pseudomonas sp. CCI4.2]MEB0103095.1 hypothetical protein [Pseudomonas sp. CCI3.2]MEB0122356.1 hypothetical protein [Pseudomonas sp. CCI1.2]MEB0130782.1 hypothetical protein [Pseudomonas sp. CCI2.4]
MDILKKKEVLNSRVAINRFNKRRCSVLAVCTSLLFTGGLAMGADEGVSAASATPMANGSLELYKNTAPTTGNGTWQLRCTIPLPEIGTKGEVDVYLDSHIYGCNNDEAYGYRLIDAGIMSFGFYDKKCGDSHLYDDDYFEYKVMAHHTTTGIVKRLDTGVGIGQEVTPGVKYISGAYHNGIDGKLSCVRFFSIANTGGISGN